LPKINESELKAILADERADAIASFQSSKITSERKRAMDYYQGDVSDDIPSVKGRSQATSTDVMDTVEGLMPSLMEIFAGSDDAVRFEPVGPEDIPAAEQETEYVKHVFWNKNDGFTVLYSMIKDALLSKTGIAKVWWDSEVRDHKESYFDQSDDQMMMIVQDQNVEVLEHTAKQDDYGMPAHDLVVRRKETNKSAKVMAVPPEEFGIARRARCVRDAHYIYHEPNGGRAQADLIAEGYDAAQIKSLPSYSSPTNTEQFARDTAEETSGSGGDEGMNRAMRPIRITEHYIRMEYEGDGKARLYRVVTGGEDSTVLRRNGKPDIEEWDFMPFAVMTPVIMPHRVFGKSVADLVMDIQQIKTVLLRGLLDNTYAANMPRPVVSEEFATTETLDDLSVFRHGAPIRVKRPGAIEWQQVPPIINHVFPVLQYLDAMREWRTGVTRQGQGLDANALQNQTATAAAQLYNAAQARMKLIARVFAETGIKDLFWLLHATLRKNANKAETVRLTNKWVPIDPRNWSTRNDITVCVGLGQGGKQERLQQYMMIGSLQKQAMEGGLMNLVQPKHLYNTAREIAKVLETDVDLFFQDPGDEKMPPKPSPEEMKAQIEKAKLQADMQKTQMESQFRMQEMQGKAEIERLQAEADIATGRDKMQADLALAERKFQLDRELKIAEFQMEREMKQMDMQAKGFQHELDVEKAGLDMETSTQKAALDMHGKAADQQRKADADKQKQKQEAPITGAMKKLQEQQAAQSEQMAKLLEAVESDREIEIKRDARGKAAGAVSRRKKKT
jgi:hypothetical protein